MNRAEIIVNRLLEASVDGTTLRFGPGDDEFGDEYPTLEQAVGAPGDEALQQAIQRGHTFVVQKAPNDVQVFGLKPVIKSTQGVLDWVSKIFNLPPDAQVHFSNGPHQGSGKQVPLEKVFFEKPDKLQRQEKTAQGMATAPRSTHPDMMEPDAEREEYVGQVSKQPVAQNVPLDWGLEVHPARKGTDGVRVISVIPNGPSARGKIQPGDRIVEIGPFETERGFFGPYRIRDRQDWDQTMRFVQPGYTIPLGVVRNNRLLKDRNVRPEVKKAQEVSDVTRITRGGEDYSEYSQKEADIRRKLEGSRNDLGSFTIADLAQILDASPRMIEVVLNDLGIRTKDFAPMNQRPNQREPARVTGNQKANVAALT